MTFKASLDKLAKGVTTGITVLFALIIIGQIFLFDAGAHLTALITSVLIVVVYAIGYIFRPIDYILTNENLIIHRQVQSVIIDRKKIKRVELVPEEKISRSIRTFGVGGLFGYYGHFVNSKFGNMTWYATRRDKAVLVETVDDKKLIVTPDDPDEFIKQLNSF